jgi:hypothetical protein
LVTTTDISYWCGHICIIEIHHVEVDPEDKIPLTPLNETPAAQVEGIFFLMMTSRSKRTMKRRKLPCGATIPPLLKWLVTERVATPGAVKFACAEFTLISKFVVTDPLAEEKTQEATFVKDMFWLESSWTPAYFLTLSVICKWSEAKC